MSLNAYQKKARKQSILSGFDSVGNVATLPTKGDWQSSSVETFKDLLIGAAGGGLLAAAFGRWSLLAGLGTSFGGYILGSRTVTAFGLGMMASGTYQVASSSVNGPEMTLVEGVKERVKAFGQDFKHRLFLDKILKSKKSETDPIVSGLGDVRYFNYPSQPVGQLDMSALERLEEQVNQSARQYTQNKPIPAVSGLAGEIGVLMEERIY